MHRLYKITTLIASAFATIILLSIPVNAQSLTWYVRSEYPYTVSLKFFSQGRNHVWPGGNEVWILNDSQTHTFNLECYQGENICYGAWPRGNSRTYWGVGQYGRHYCNHCCYTCNGGETRVQVLQ